MTASYCDLRAGRDFLVSGSVILLLTALMVLIAVWYVKPRATVPLPPARCRVTLIPSGLASTSLAPIHFSLPSKIGFSRTLRPGDPRLTTTLGPRPEDIRFLPREKKAELLLPAPEPAAAPGFTPWSEGAPVFAPVTPVRTGWTMTAEPAGGAEVALPADFSAAAQWPAQGPWSAVVRLEAGADGRVEHVFLMPPPPEPAVAARLEGLMRRARLGAGGREGRIKIRRVEPAAGADAEGARP